MAGNISFFLIMATSSFSVVKEMATFPPKLKMTKAMTRAGTAIVIIFLISNSPYLAANAASVDLNILYHALQQR